MRVVVGVSGSPACRGAVRAAWDTAVAHAAPLDVVSVWTPPAAPDYAGLGELPQMEATLARAAEQTAALVLAEVAEERGTPAPRTSVQAVCGSPGPALVGLVGQHDRLFVGGPQPGRLHRMVPGSVASYLLRHAPCPVTVVPCPAQAAPVQRGRALRRHDAPQPGPTSSEVEMMARLVR